MFHSTLKQIRCLCGKTLSLVEQAPRGALTNDIETGELTCKSCKASYPILAGVAVLVEDLESYFIEHVKGISALVPDAQIPKSVRASYLDAKAELGPEHIEEDLESDRVNALYILNHYAKAGDSWLKLDALASPAIVELIDRYWDHGPMSYIEKLAPQWSGAEIVDLGCNVGGVATRVAPHAKTYLGLDSSFAAIALARHLALGAPYPRPIQIPGDLLLGPVSRPFTRAKGADSKNADFVVSDLTAVPLADASCDVAIALNAIDMLEDPVDQPRLQRRLLRASGVAVQSCPYIWHEQVSKNWRKRLPKDVKSSHEAVLWLYKKNGFQIAESHVHVPWLFFKHVRQIELYSVHFFTAKNG